MKLYVVITTLVTECENLNLGTRVQICSVNIYGFTEREIPLFRLKTGDSNELVLSAPKLEYVCEFENSLARFFKDFTKRYVLKRQNVEIK